MRKLVVLRECYKMLIGYFVKSYFIFVLVSAVMAGLYSWFYDMILPGGDMGLAMVYHVLDCALYGLLNSLFLVMLRSMNVMGNLFALKKTIVMESVCYNVICYALMAQHFAYSYWRDDMIMIASFVGVCLLVVVVVSILKIMQKIKR